MKKFNARFYGVPAMILCSIVGCLHAGWWQTFGGGSGDQGYCVQQVSDGGYIVTGYTSLTPNNNEEIWLIKLDSHGDTEWTKTYGEGRGSSVWQTTDGGYAIGGSKLIRTDGSGDTLWAREWAGITRPTSDDGYIITTKKLDAVWLLKLNENGDSIWARSYPQIGSYADLPSWVEQTSDGGYIITGLANDVDTEFMVEKTALFLHKTDSNGNTLWIKTYGGVNWDDLDRGRYVKETSDGGYIVVGFWHTGVFWTLKTDSYGDTLWSREYGGGEGLCIQETSEGNYIATGEGPAMNATLSLSPAGGDLWLLKINPDGDTIWTRSYGGDGTDVGHYVQQTSDSGYIVTGYTYVFTPAGNTDLYLLKTDSLGLLGVTEELVTVAEKNWKVITPVGSCIRLSFVDRPQGFRANIYNALGRKVDELHISVSSGIVEWGLGYPSGVYFIQVTEKSHTSTARVVLVQ